MVTRAAPEHWNGYGDGGERQEARGRLSAAAFSPVCSSRKGSEAACNEEEWLRSRKSTTSKRRIMDNSENIGGVGLGLRKDDVERNDRNMPGAEHCKERAAANLPHQVEERREEDEADTIKFCRPSHQKIN